MIIGLTGGIGSGKTLASDYLRDHHGFEILDNDVTAREVVAIGSPLLLEIAAHFGPEVLQSDGGLNRAWLRDTIFSNPTEKTWLESVTHPEIRNRTLERLGGVGQNEILILVSPLLFESQQDQLCDQTIAITTPVDIQVTRVQQRDGNSSEQVARIMNNQLQDEGRTQQATHILYNDSTMAHLYQQLDTLVQQWKTA
jgi:dephospho-CoA kinase